MKGEMLRVIERRYWQAVRSKVLQSDPAARTRYHGTVFSCS
jgi:hypothetical protein